MRETQQPSAEDYCLTPSGPLGGRTQVAQHQVGIVGEYPDTETALLAVKEDMDCERYFPDIWWVSDHGNAWQIDLDGNEIKETQPA